jgi:hypothetical protein
MVPKIRQDSTERRLHRSPAHMRAYSILNNDRFREKTPADAMRPKIPCLRSLKNYS